MWVIILLGGIMKNLFIWYPKCSTCVKAKKWLDENGIDYEIRDIILDNPSYDELDFWINKSGMEIKKFFNTSGLKYKELGLKDKLNSLSDSEKIKLLANDGMLVKRPLLIGKIIIPGFKDYDRLK